MKAFKKWAVNRELWRPKLIVINHASPIWDRIKAGNYFHVDMDINAESFPLLSRDEVEEKTIKFYHRPLGLEISTQKAIFRIGRAKRMGVPIGIEELFAIGEQYPALQLEYPMVALGTVCRCEFMEHDGFAFPCLYEIDGKRELGLTRFRCKPEDYIWAKGYRFPYFVPQVA